MGLDGRWAMGEIGCDLAANAVTRQTLVADSRHNAQKMLACERPALLAIYVEPEHVEEAIERITTALNGPEVRARKEQAA